MKRAALAAIAMIATVVMATAKPVDRVAPAAPAATDKTFQFYEPNDCPLQDEQNQDCFVDFPATPRGLKANITGASCQIDLFTDAAGGVTHVQLLILNAREKILSAQSLQPTLFFQNANNRHWAVNHPITAFAEKGSRAEIVIGLHLENKGSKAQAHCHVSGHYTPA